jgi:hypothetical protein
VPGADGVYKSYEKCADFFTFGKGSTFGTFADGVNGAYWALTAIGFTVMIVFLVWWVVMEDRKLKAQAAHLRSAGISSSIHTHSSVETEQT